MSHDEEDLQRSVALQAESALEQARQRAEHELLDAKAALREREELLRAVFSQAAVGIVLATTAGTITEVNRRFCDIVGYADDELIGVPVETITHASDVPATREVLHAMLAGEIGESAYEKRLVRKDGAVIWARVGVTLIRGAGGEPQRLLGIIEDVTRRKEAEEALRDEARMLELLHATGAVLSSNLDLHSLVQAVTDAATRLSGAKFGAFFYNVVDPSGEAFLLYALSGAPISAFEGFGLPRNTAVFEPTFRGGPVLRSGDITKDERYGRLAPHFGMPPGHLAVKSYLAVPVVLRSGEVIGGLFFGHPDPDVFGERAERIVTGVAAQAAVAIDNARLYESAQLAAQERSRLLENERSARHELQRLSELKDEFLATLSHELRTPLSAILGWVYVLRAKPMPREEMSGALDTIERNARIQTQLIEDLLDMSRITSGKLRLEVQVVQPADVVQAAIKTVQPGADAKAIRLEAVLDPNAGPITGDPSRLQQVVWNLLSNAIKFTPKGGRIHVLLRRVASHVEISVADDGIGIEPEFLAHVFERFRQADASSSRSFGGLGLGLSIAKHLVEQHGGTIEAQSAGKDRGTTFTVRLPLVAVGQPHEPDAGADTITPRPVDRDGVDLSGVRVLVVDDDQDSRMLLKHVLEEAHAAVAVAAGAEEAIPYVRRHELDLLISDIGMPGADGYELLRRVRRLVPPRGSVPAIALTAFARSEDRTRALREGYLMHLAKPVDPVELLAVVASVVGRSRGRT